MNEINESPDLEMAVLKEISSAVVQEHNGTALLQHMVDWCAKVVTDRNSGNMSAVARELGTSPMVLHYKMHRLGLQKR